MQAGVRELLVISQDTSAYGVDLRYATSTWRGRTVRARFLDLAKRAGRVGAWVRLHYVYPYPHVDDVIPLMAEGKVLPYLDIPFQHASPGVLKAMRRPANQEKVLDRIRALARDLPGPRDPLDLHRGLPGRDRGRFRVAAGLAAEAQLDRVGCFRYEPVEGAPANGLPDPVLEEVKEERWQRLMAHQQAISAGRLGAKVGSRIEVIVDEVGHEVIGRSKGDAPEVDGRVVLEAGPGLAPGDIVAALVTGSDAYDLRARLAP